MKTKRINSKITSKKISFTTNKFFSSIIKDKNRARSLLKFLGKI